MHLKCVDCNMPGIDDLEGTGTFEPDDILKLSEIVESRGKWCEEIILPLMEEEEYNPPMNMRHKRIHAEISGDVGVPLDEQEIEPEDGDELKRMAWWDGVEWDSIVGMQVATTPHIPNNTNHAISSMRAGIIRYIQKKKAENKIVDEDRGFKALFAFDGIVFF